MLFERELLNGTKSTFMFLESVLTKWNVEMISQLEGKPLIQIFISNYLVGTKEVNKRSIENLNNYKVSN